MRQGFILTMGFLGAACLSLAACQDSSSKSDNAPPQTMAQAPHLAAIPLRKQFQCLPREAALVAAHRGVSKGEGFAENSASSLKALIEKGIMVAEVDVAGLKDGTLILYHDGVWEEKSTGKGPIASSLWADAERILLHDTDGALTADRPVSFSDVLSLSKDRLYLEIDFKSSAKFEAVIDAIRDHGMADRVILIAYTEGQARKLAELAPEMLLSVGIKESSDIAALEALGVDKKNMTAWLGRGPFDNGLIDRLDSENIPVLAWPGRDYVSATAAPASLIVSDYAFGLDPIAGLTNAGRKTYEACLNK